MPEKEICLKKSAKMFDRFSMLTMMERLIMINRFAIGSVLPTAIASGLPAAEKNCGASTLIR